MENQSQQPSSNISSRMPDSQDGVLSMEIAAQSYMPDPIRSNQIKHKEDLYEHKPQHHHDVVSLFTKRTVLQYFEGNNFCRVSGERKASVDELFLDLVIVAAIATLSHQLEVPDFTAGTLFKFVVFYQAIWSVWRESLLLWNVWGTFSDLFDWFMVLIIMGSLLVISSASDGGFAISKGWVSGSAAVANGFLAFLWMLGGFTDPIFKSKHPLKNVCVWYGLQLFAVACIYTIGAVVPSDQVTYVMYIWAFTCNAFRLIFSPLITRYLLKPEIEVAIDLEVMTERFGLVTIIVFGETVLTVSLVGANILSETINRQLIGMAILSLVATYSFHGYYFRIDSVMLYGAKHAIRTSMLRSVIWYTSHFFTHVALISAAAGISSLLEDTASGSSDHSQEFWLLCGGWGCALVSMAGIGASHKKGPGYRSKVARLLSRLCIGVFIATMPLYVVGKLSPLSLLGITAAIVTGQFWVEFFCLYFIDFRESERLQSTHEEMSAADPQSDLHFSAASFDFPSSRRGKILRTEHRDFEVFTVAGHNTCQNF